MTKGRVLWKLRRAAKTYRCHDCLMPIPKGAVHYTFADKRDGSLRTLRTHSDCRSAVTYYVDEIYIPGGNDGTPPLAHMLFDSGEFEAECGLLRGRFPHVISRIELNEQLAENRREEENALRLRRLPQKDRTNG